MLEEREMKWVFLKIGSNNSSYSLKSQKDLLNNIYNINNNINNTYNKILEE